MSLTSDLLSLPSASALAAAVLRLRARSPRDRLSEMPHVTIAADKIHTLVGPDEFRDTLFALLASARKRILMTALYLQDDDAGREVLAALHAAKAARPGIDIAIFVDWHRAQRGLIGKGASPGNTELYIEMARRFGPGVEIHGVPVQMREWLGVMHLKGFVIDDTVLYSGASLNDVYLHRHQRYRLDRYHLFESRPLADSLAILVNSVLRNHPAVARLDVSRQPSTASLRGAIGGLRRTLMRASYPAAERVLADSDVAVIPLMGLGARNNALNRVILQLIRRAEHELVLFTPYFNLPREVKREIEELTRRRCRVRIIVGDKTANDFYIPPDQPFRTIGALPYLYERNLRRFCKSLQGAVDGGLLDLYLWRHEDHSFHLKGLLVDQDHALLTGSNINPRAWRLDLENGLLIRDPRGHLIDQHRLELERVLAHSRRLTHYQELEDVGSYPLPVQRLLKRLARTRIDRLVNQVL